MTTSYHAVMIDECGSEFGVSFQADGPDDAYDYLADNFPECRVGQLEDPQQQHQREQRLAYEAERNYWND